VIPPARRAGRALAALAVLPAAVSLLGPTAGAQPPRRPAPAGAAGPVTLAVVNARVWTGAARRPWADAVVVRGDRLALVGGSAEARKLAAGSPGARVVDARGQMLVPGFTDAHVHFVDGGFRLASVQLRDAATPEEFVRRIGAFAATVPAGTWIRGGDWDHERWGGRLPTRAWIDAVTPDHPVWVNRLDGHMALANSRALALAGVTRGTPDPRGGTLVRDAAGEPTGVLKDNAMAYVDRAVPPADPGELDRAVDAATAYVARQGVTSVHAMGSWEDLAAYERARDAGRLRTRVYAAVPLETWARLRDTVAAWHAEGHRLAGGLAGDRWLQIGGLKGFVDGSLGAHTAAMLAPFADAPDDRGLFVTPRDSLFEWTRAAAVAGLQVMVHAIGDRAIRTQLDVFERVAGEVGARDRRWRLEHAQHFDPADVPRVAALGVVASMQPYHAIDDGRWAERVIGPARAQLTYAFRALLDARARLAFGSDWFVAPPTPLEGIYAAVTRRTLDGRHPDGWVPGQRITVDEALRAYTAGGAYARFAEAELGTLETGKLADFVLVDRDLTRVPPATIRDARVVLTVVGGPSGVRGLRTSRRP
jgi:predicted amidohydrolase YtcJ